MRLGRVSRTTFIRWANMYGEEEATLAAMSCGVSFTQIQLWLEGV